MAEVPQDDRLGTRREFEIRDDDRPDDKPYSRRRPLGTALLVVAVIVVIAGLIAYFSQHRSGPPTQGWFPVDSGRR